MNHSLRFTAEKLGKRIELVRSLVRRTSHTMDPFQLEILDSASAMPGSGRNQGEVAWNSYWAEQNTHFVLTSTFTIPSGFTNPALYLPLGVAGDIFTHPEALVRVNNQLIGSADRYHQFVPLQAGLSFELESGKTHSLELQGWTGLTGWPPDPQNTSRLQINPCSVVDVDTSLQEFIILAEVTLDVANTVKNDDRTSDKLLQALDKAFLVLDTRHPMQHAFRDSVPEALHQLRSSIADVGDPLSVRLHGIGHAHMDIAYLWPIEQIRQKSARTCSNVLNLMNQYPNFRFSQTQPQLYAFLETDFPELFQRIQRRVEEGRWEVMGGMWVEPDCNIPGGESLVRQLTLGREYFNRNFADAETPVLWLPDTFGFPWSLPQLIRQAGLTGFVTNKLNWNQYNAMPSSTTWWQGIDGTRVLTHCLTTPRKVQHLPFPTNYKSDLSTAEVLGTWTNATTGEYVQDLPIAYGYGDGGGGPTQELIQKAIAYQSMPGVPAMQMSTVRAVMLAIREQADSLPVWNDELYLEGHRGTLTSQAWIKRANRLAERSLHDTEAALAMASPTGLDRDTLDELKSIWQLVCLNQFHDIVTGTSVAEVFDDARRDYESIMRRSALLRDKALLTLVENQSGYVLFNFSPAHCTTPVLLPDHSGIQCVEEGSLAWASVPAYTTGQCDTDAPGKVWTQANAAGWVLENKLLRAEFDLTGTLKVLFDKVTHRQMLAPENEGNQLWAFEDRPLSWDAWDIDVFHDERSEIVTGVERVELVETGPLRASLRITRQWRNSRFTQDIQLCAESARLDFNCHISWHEQHTLLKVAFPVNVLSPRATFDIQWGEIERPTHRNTHFDYARFEVAAHKWVDLSERGFGVAVLNDCKYGYSVRENTIWLSLIKSSTSPDVGADQGEHVFTYSVLAHDGDLCAVRNEARCLNDPLIVVPGCQTFDRAPIIACDAPNVILETLKPSNDGVGFIVRLYEADRRRGPVHLHFGQPMQAVYHCDLFEQTNDCIELDGEMCALNLAPFEIVSLKCVPR